MCFLHTEAEKFQERFQENFQANSCAETHPGSLCTAFSSTLAFRSQAAKESGCSECPSGGHRVRCGLGRSVVQGGGSAAVPGLCPHAAVHRGLGDAGAGGWHSQPRLSSSPACLPWRHCHHSRWFAFLLLLRQRPPSPHHPPRGLPARGLYR